MPSAKTPGKRAAVALIAVPLVASGAYGAEEPITTVVVVGKRASMMSAQQQRRDALEVVDAVVAEDINRLPDQSVADALQRITGVQIARDRGEGGVVTVRGLSQFETTLNGREVFTAGTGRILDFADIPAEMVASINVYKTSAASQIEGGIGGLVDLRTRRPFDFAGRQITGSARLVHGELVGSSAPQYSVLASQRWKAGKGEVAALINLAQQKRAWREDQKGSGTPTTRTDLIAGQSVVTPNGTSETTSLGHRERSAATAILQWRPWPELELYAEGGYARFKTIQDSYQINVPAGRTFVDGSVALFPGTNDLQRITWTNVPLSILSFARDTVDRNRQLAAGALWRRDGLTLKADLSHTDSFNNLFFSGPFFSATAASFTHDLSTSPPGSSLGATDLLDPAKLQYTGLAYRVRPFEGKLNALRLDAEYARPQGLVRQWSAGWRVARRGAGNAPGLIFADAPLTGISAASRPGEVLPNPYSDYFPGEPAPSIRHFLVGDLTTARDALALRQRFGVTAPIPAAGGPLGIWDIHETTHSAYLMARFDAGRWPLDGNAGLRVLRTRTAVSGNRSVPATGAIAPIQRDSSDTDFLPSLNLRYRAAEGLYLRAAASKTMTRPNFDQLSPSLTLLRNPVTPSANQGGAGNPDLRAIRSRNVDLAVERHFSRSSYAHLTAFLKQVDGFVANVSSPETYDGVTYQVSRPRNTNTADIKGAELGFQRFFDFLPGAWSGLGMQANYTFVDSAATGSIPGTRAPLQNLSRHSANLIALYEKDRIAARLAYNWRDTFVSGVATVVGVGTLPVYTGSYGWLDASLSYRINDSVSLELEGSNLLNTVRRAYFGVPTRPQSSWMNDRQLSLNLTIRM